MSKKHRRMSYKKGLWSPEEDQRLKDYILKHGHGVQFLPKQEQKFYSLGAAAGTMGQTVAYPLDVIRRRMQMVGWKDAASVVRGDGRVNAPLEYSGMVDAFRKIVRHEGFRALYKGLILNSIKLYMQRFVTKKIEMMKFEKLFASQGGLIILSQAILIVWSKRAGKYEYSVTTTNFSAT